MNVDGTLTTTTTTTTRFGTTIHITALDGIINVNSLFTLAVFIGLAWQPTDPNNTLIDTPSCIPGPHIAENLICFHVYSFSSFLFSSLVALSLKQAIRITTKTSCETRRLMMFSFDTCHINQTVLKIGYLFSAAGSVCGCGFLMMALVNVVQIKVGVLGCGGGYGYAAVVPLLVFVPLGLLIYVFFVLFAFTR